MSGTPSPDQSVSVRNMSSVQIVKSFVSDIVL